MTRRTDKSRHQVYRATFHRAIFHRRQLAKTVIDVELYPINATVAEAWIATQLQDWTEEQAALIFSREAMKRAYR